MGRFLWDTFANKPEERKFSRCTTENLQQRAREFSRALVNRAKAMSLDATALDSCLVRVEQTGLPVGAYATTQGEIPVWIVVVKWETISETLPFAMVHIAISAFDAQTYTRVGFISCN